MSRTQIFVIISGVVLGGLVLELVRRRRLREEYSWLWLLTGAGYLAVAVWPGLAGWMAGIVGSQRPTSAFTFLGLLFLFLISIQFSVEFSRLKERNKDLAQQVAILDSELRVLAEACEGRGEQGSGQSRGKGELDGAAPAGPVEAAG
jgi:MFS family permease